MRLPCDLPVLRALDSETLRAAILERRNVIRPARDARGDDRCWADDWPIWLMLADTVLPAWPMPEEEIMRRCRRFWFQRRRTRPDLEPDEWLERESWDADLPKFNHGRLVGELFGLQWGIRFHRDSRPSFKNDRALYRMLPENWVADFRLPPKEQFLGEALAPHAGCPAYIRSHRGCGLSVCSPHQWGPCSPTNQRPA